MITSVAFTVYPVTDIARARKFYEETLGLKMTHNWSDQWVEYDLGDTTFAITTPDESLRAGAKGASVAFEVTDFDQFTRMLKERGFTFEVNDGSVCRMAVVHDPDGNVLIIHKRKTG
jgi:catechol 2,3-dioxygenase-like lactoylglutathione lyase family enzyme